MIMHLIVCIKLHLKKQVPVFLWITLNANYVFILLKRAPPFSSDLGHVMFS